MKRLREKPFWAKHLYGCRVGNNNEITNFVFDEPGHVPYWTTPQGRGPMSKNEQRVWLRWAQPVQCVHPYDWDRIYRLLTFVYQKREKERFLALSSYISMLLDLHSGMHIHKKVLKTLDTDGYTIGWHLLHKRFNKEKPSFFYHSCDKDVDFFIKLMIHAPPNQIHNVWKDWECNPSLSRIGSYFSTPTSCIPLKRLQLHYYNMVSRALVCLIMIGFPRAVVCEYIRRMLYWGPMDFLIIK